MELEHELFVCGTHALAFYLSPRAKRLDKAFEERVSRGLPAGQLPNFISYADQPLSRPAACAMPLHSCTPVVSNAEARELRAFFGSTLPLNVMVPAKGERRNSSRMCCWIHPAAVPRENYLHLAKGLFIASPELAAMQVCPFYSEVDAIVLMSMLCSFYVENPQAAGGLEPRRAPCTPESFGIFLAQMDPSTPIPNGRSRLMRCLRSAVSNAASPAELQLALALSLPKRLGGFALPKPMLNCSVQTQEGTVLRPDLYWPDKRVAVEYQSDANHSGSGQLARDRSRKNLFQSAGITLFEASSAHLRDPYSMEGLGRMLTDKLGKPAVDSGARERLERAESNKDIERALDHFGKLWL